MTKLRWISSLLLALSFSGCDLENGVLPEMSSMSKTQSLGKEKSLDADVRFGVGSLEVSADSASTLYSVDLEYDRAHFQPEVRYDSEAAGEEGRLSVRLDSTGKFRPRIKAQRNRLRLGLTDAVPLKLTVNTGVGSARLSLSRLKVASLEVEAGVGGAKISSYDPNNVECNRIRIRNGVGGMEAIGLGNLNFRELVFEGGVGGADLDFTGEWKQDAEIRIQVGVGGVTVRMPRHIGVEVDAARHFLSGLHLDGFTKRDARYYSENYDSAKIRVMLRVATGVGGMKITWV